MTATELVMDMVGWLGAGILLLAYWLVSIGRRRAGGRVFQTLNLVGSAGLAVSSGFHSAWPSAALNVLWMAVGVAALSRLRRNSGTGGT